MGPIPCLSYWLPSAPAFGPETSFRVLTPLIPCVLVYNFCCSLCFTLMSDISKTLSVSVHSSSPRSPTYSLNYKPHPSPPMPSNLSPFAYLLPGSLLLEVLLYSLCVMPFVSESLDLPGLCNHTAHSRFSIYRRKYRATSDWDAGRASICAPIPNKAPTKC